MSQSKLKNTRPLGSVRGKITLEKKFQIPKWNIKQLDQGVQGNAIPNKSQTCETLKDLNDKHNGSHNSERIIQENKGLTASLENEISHETCKKEIEQCLKKEKLLQEQLDILHQQNEEQQAKLMLALEQNETLQKQLIEQEEHLTNELFHEKELHSSTQKSLDETKKEMQQTRDNLVQIIENQQEEMTKQIMNLELRLSEKDAIISDRDQKLNKLKTQMADALKGNSWERQQQLEELTKELARVQKEYDALYIRYKSLSKSKQPDPR
ncbi:hypothetical protein Btru_019332 [Bulinus truncatus]|nr:hypothetical protein Btru_019332 [Bulinus truncatus]